MEIAGIKRLEYHGRGKKGFLEKVDIRKKITEKRRIDGMVSLLNAWVLYVKYLDDFMYRVGV